MTLASGLITSAIKQRVVSQAADPAVLADIYRDDVNIAIWQRQLSSSLREEVAEFLLTDPSYRASFTLASVNVLDNVVKAIGDKAPAGVMASIAELVDMFCYLFDVKRVGARLSVLDKAMCPRFHVDRVPCRLVSTFHGVATQWLPHDCVDRSKLGHGSGGKPDSESGLYRKHTDIQQVDCGDVALLKGELWDGNENAGLVHRSPVVPSGESRLLFTLDFMD